MDKQIYQSRLWTDDLDRVVSSLPILDKLSGQTVLITGATGLIGSAVTDVLLRYTRHSSRPIRIYAAGRSAQRMEARFGAFLRQKDVVFVPYEAAAYGFPLPDIRFDYIIHGAGNATPAKMMEEPVETMLANFYGMQRLLDCARDKQTKRTVYISSSEVYGQKETAAPFREDEYGKIDLLNPRSAYPMAKRATETLCISYAHEYGTDCVIVRPGHIYGPTASMGDNRVSSAWAYAAAKGKPIIMKSDGAQVRSYCYCLDCASAILTVMLKGSSGSACNISHPDSVISIREMAELLAKAGGVPILHEASSREEQSRFNPMNNSSLDSSSLLARGWRGLFDAPTGLSHTVAILKDCI